MGAKSFMSFVLGFIVVMGLGLCTNEAFATNWHKPKPNATAKASAHANAKFFGNFVMLKAINHIHIKYRSVRKR